MDFNKDKVLEMAESRIIEYSGRSLCENYKSPLERCENASQAIRLYKNCISWALLEKYPTKEEMLSFAENSVWEENGVYIDRTFDGERIDSHICCVFISCNGRISTGLNIDKEIIPKLYLSEGSRLKIDVDAGMLYPIDVETYYSSSAEGENLRIKDCNTQERRSNVNFSEKELGVAPDIENEQL